MPIFLTIFLNTADFSPQIPINPFFLMLLQNNKKKEKKAKALFSENAETFSGVKVHCTFTFVL